MSSGPGTVRETEVPKHLLPLKESFLAKETGDSVRESKGSIDVLVLTMLYLRGCLPQKWQTEARIASSIFVSISLKVNKK